MTLLELRKQWEEGGVPIIAVPLPHGQTVYVVVERQKAPSQPLGHDCLLCYTAPSYDLLRYFQIGNDWSVSQDLVNREEVGDALKPITKALAELYPDLPLKYTD